MNTSSHKFYRKILDNGLRVILVPLGSNSITTGFFIRAGAYHEIDNNNGVAHFLEHMMFQGTTHRPRKKLVEQLDSLGVQYNAATSYEYTFYYLKGYPTDWKTLLDITIDIYRNPLFEQSTINSEKKVVTEEIKMNYDNPDRRLVEIIHSKVFAHSPLRRNIPGTVESVGQLTKKHLQEFRQQFYHPTNTVIVVTGRFNPSQVLKYIALKTKNIHRTNYGTVQPIIYRTIHYQTRPYVYAKNNSNLNQIHLALMFRAYPKYDNKTMVTSMIGDILTSGFSSRLYQSLRNSKGLVYNINLLNTEYIDDGLFGIHLSTSPNKMLDAIEICLKEIKSFRDKNANKTELDKAKKIKIAELLTSHESPIDIFTYYGLSELFYQVKKPQNIRETIASYQSIDLPIIAHVANEIFQPSKLNLFIYGDVKDNLDLDRLGNIIGKFD